MLGRQVPAWHMSSGGFSDTIARRIDEGHLFALIPEESGRR